MELHDFLIVFHWWKNNILTSKFQLRTLFSTSDNQCKYVRIAIFSDFWAMYTFISDDSGSAKYQKLGINLWSRLSATWPKIVISLSFLDIFFAIFDDFLKFFGSFCSFKSKSIFRNGKKKSSLQKSKPHILGTRIHH